MWFGLKWSGLGKKTHFVLGVKTVILLGLNDTKMRAGILEMSSEWSGTLSTTS